MTIHILLRDTWSALAIFGVVTSTIYSLMVAAAVVRFRRQAGVPGHLGEAAFTPAVSVLKALHGNEPDLEANLSSFFEQDYPGYEILFCARHQNDAGLAVARRVAERYPHIEARFLTCGEPQWPNARTWSLEVMCREARYPLFVACDSDVRVGRDYLAAIVQPLRDEQVGMVTCVYRGVTRLGLWARLEAMGMSVEMTSGVLVAAMLEGMQFALGPSMAFRKRSVEKIGGFAEVAQYYADDFVLGNWMAQAGERVILSPYVVEHHVLNSTFAGSMAHQQGWATSTRFSRPAGHVGTGLTFAVPFGLLAWVTMGLTGHPGLGFALFLFTVLNRVLLCALVGGVAVRDKATLMRAWLYPLRDLMGFCFWLRSFAGNRVGYRGEAYELLPHGRLRKLTPEPEREPVAAKTS